MNRGLAKCGEILPAEPRNTISDKCNDSGSRKAEQTPSTSIDTPRILIPLRPYSLNPFSSIFVRRTRTIDPGIALLLRGICWALRLLRRSNGDTQNPLVAITGHRPKGLKKQHVMEEV